MNLSKKISLFRTPEEINSKKTTSLAVLCCGFSARLWANAEVGTRGSFNQRDHRIIPPPPLSEEFTGNCRKNIREKRSSGERHRRIFTVTTPISSRRVLGFPGVDILETGHFLDDVDWKIPGLHLERRGNIWILRNDPWNIVESPNCRDDNFLRREQCNVLRFWNTRYIYHHRLSYVEEYRLRARC